MTDHVMHGVRGALVRRPWPGTAQFAYQVFTASRVIDQIQCECEIRFDDSCNNGKNSFAIACFTYECGVLVAGGADHETFTKVFPELAHLTKWHLMQSTGPMHYVVNTLWHSQGRDCWGLRAGETRPQLKRDGTPVRRLVGVTADGAERPVYDLSTLKEGEPLPVLAWRDVMLLGEGNPVNLDYARSIAVWPVAPDELLTGPADILESALMSRLPDLIAAFRRDIESAGFEWAPCEGVSP
jgi:hypothetical protein